MAKMIKKQVRINSTAEIGTSTPKTPIFKQFQEWEELLAHNRFKELLDLSQKEGESK